MNMLRFTADASLYETIGHYVIRGHTPILTGEIYLALTRRNGFTGVGGGQLVGGVTAFTCSGLLCSCTGDSDCNDMFSSDVCGDIASCDEGGCRCLRI